jgi:hypothetical protein
MLNLSVRAAVALTFITMASPGAYATSTQQQAERKLEEGANALLEGMRLMLKTIPWYGQPVVKPNGDIVIPRREAPTLPPANKQPPRPSDEEADGDTKRL